MDKAGNLYGTASIGGSTNNGTVFQLSHKGSGWVFTPLYSFQGSPDGTDPGPVTFGPDGSLYGTTLEGGLQQCGAYDNVPCGTVFNLRPSAAACKTALCPWTETVIYRPTSNASGGWPNGPTFDPAGNMYISMELGFGVMKLVPSNGGWQETLHRWIQNNDGMPSGVTLDAADNVYGVTPGCGVYGQGCVFQLTGPVWTQNVLYSFHGGSDGAAPIGGLIFDDVGNLYGTTYQGGEYGGGTVFELTPSTAAGH